MACMPAADSADAVTLAAAASAGTPAGDAIDAFLRHLGDRGLSATTRRIRGHYLREYLKHARQAARDAAAANAPDDVPVVAPELTAGELMDAARASAWLADAAAGKTRSRASSRGREAAAYPNSMRVRADTWNSFAEFLGLDSRLQPPKPADGYRLPVPEAEKLVHDLAIRRAVTANAMTAIRTAAVAALVADTGRGVPELASLQVSALDLSGEEPGVEIDGERVPLAPETAHVLARWLATRASIIEALEGSDPGHLWIPVKPGRARGDDPVVKPGITAAAVRTLHHAHRVYVSHMLGTPLRPGALRGLRDDAAVTREEGPAEPPGLDRPE